MALLVDTQVLIWFLEDNEKLSGHAREMMIAHDEPVFVSVATLWEAAIKKAAGKLKISHQFPDMITTSGFKQLPIEMTHAWQTLRLPMIHKDPFDRLLVAQAREGHLTIVTQDPIFEKYDVSVLKA